MTIRLGSRYENSVVDFVARFPDADANPVVFYAFSELGQVTYTEYTFKRGDRLDTLATEFYGNPRFWWIIAEYNPEVEDIQNITPGTVLRIAHV